MRPVTTDVEAREARGRARLDARAKKARKSHLRRLALEGLEARTLLAALPPVTVTGQVLPRGSYNNTDNAEYESSPQLAVNPNNPLQVVAVNNQRDTNAPATADFNISARVSADGGQSWTNVSLPGRRSDPSKTAAPFGYDRADSISVAWNTQNEFYVLHSQHNTANSVGEIILSRHNANGGQVAVNTVYAWNQSNLPTDVTANQRPGVLDAVIAVDTNVSYTDPSTGIQQINPNTDRVYIAWTLDTPPPATPPTPYNRFTIQLLSSSDNFVSTASIPLTGTDPNAGNLVNNVYASVGAGGRARVSVGGNTGGDPIQQYSSPRIVISGASPRTGTPGGQVTVVYNDFGSGSNLSTPLDFIFAARTTWAGAGFGVVANTQVASTTVRGAVSTGNFPLGSPASNRGIGPGVAVAVDNTLGSFSPQQGRIYVAYVNRSTADGNPADNTDVHLAYSDNGGASWVQVGRINDDVGRVDGFSGGVAGLHGRPQFLPELAVDNTTGTLLVSYLDARQDPTRVRVQTTVTASMDGGATFSPSVFANAASTAFDIAGQQTVVLGPIPENPAGAEATYGYGHRIGLAALNGRFYAAWPSNANGGNIGNLTLTTAVASGRFVAGPRVLSSTMGPVAGTSFQTFEIEYDRPVDITTVGASTVQVFFISPYGGDAAGVARAVQSVTPIGAANGGATRFLVTLQDVQTAVGSYRYTIAPTARDRIRMPATINTTIFGRGPLGNFVDQNGDGLRGTVADTFATPVQGDLLTAPIIIPGPQIVGTNVPGGTQTVPGSNAENLVVNGTAQVMTVTFDRPMRVDSFTPDDILRIVGPNGEITGPTLFAATPGLNASGIGQTIPDGTGAPLVSSLTVPSTGGTFRIKDLEVRVAIQHPRVADLTLTLVHPGPDGVFGTGDDVRIRLLDRPNVAGGNLANTTFDDQAGLNFNQGFTPFTNVYRPVDPIQSRVQGLLVDGQWRLEVLDGVRQNVGTLLNWALLATPVIEVQAVNPVGGAATQFNILFPRQQLNGTYSITVGPNISSTAGDLLDSNRNAGLDRARGTPGSPSASVAFPSAAVPVAIAPGTPAQPSVTTSTIVVPRNFTINVDSANRVGVTLTLNDLLFPDVTALEAELVAPDGTIIPLFSGPGNIPGPRANFTNTILDDFAATPIQANNAAAPFLGRFNPQQPFTAALDGKLAAGTYTLRIRNRSAQTGTLTGWSIGLPESIPGTGLGEAVADQATVGFRLFTMDPQNPVSTNTWTAVGPTRQAGSRMTGIAVDPSDRSGNTVYVGGASSGIWKTTNFLTTDPLGPTYVPLNSFGPLRSMNIGGIAVVGRNNDTRQSMIFAITGEGDTGSPGSGILRSMDGGATWQVLDSLVNFDAQGNPLPRAQRGQEFIGLTSFAIVVDPRLRPNGDAIVYAAFSGNPANAGLYRSLDSGRTWTRLRAGQATDVVLDPYSGPVDAVVNPTGNLQIVYAAFRGEGVFRSTNQGANLALMNGGIGKPQVQDLDRDPIPQPVPVSNTGVNPNGPEGRIVLGKPHLLGDPLRDAMYQGWLYAVVVRPDGSVKGLYQTKDFGQNWVLVRLPSLAGDLRGTPTNDTSLPDYDVAGGNNQGNYDIAIAVDPNDPNVVYIGGAPGLAQAGQGFSLMRVDTTRVSDAHALYGGMDRVDGGARRTFGNSPTVFRNPDNLDFGAGDAILNPTLNFYRSRTNPFSTGSTTQYVRRVESFANDGSGARWTPGMDPILAGSVDVHRLLTFRDPLTGLSRIIVADDQGIFSGVDRDGTPLGAVGNFAQPGFNRNGNLQIAQLYYGASQPSLSAAGSVGAFFYGAAQDTGFPQSTGTVLSTGDIRHSGGGGDGTGVATDQGGSGTLYRFNWPCCGGGGTDFFQVNGVGRTSGLVQETQGGLTPDPQWPYVGGSNFAVNPIAGGPTFGQVVMSSQAGRIFATVDTGRNWFVIAEPDTLDGTYAPALAYGAPDPTGPDGGFALGNMIYVGTTGGSLFVTFNGGGTWTNLSAGLDGSSVRAIVTNPTRGSREAYAVTFNGVYLMRDSRAAGATWQNITGNLFQLTHLPFDNPNEVERAILSLTSIQADYRYAIPSVPTDPSSPTFPVLYVGGYGGVFRSVDNGATWAPFPDSQLNRSVRAGGYFPVADVTDLDLALGNINPTTGRPNEAGGPNILLASTYGRGQFAIRLAPLTLATRLSPSLPAPNGSTGPNDPQNGLPIVTTLRPVIEGSSQTSAFGNVVTVQLLDLTNVDLNDPAAIAAAAVVGTGTTDAFGRFAVQLFDSAGLPPGSSFRSAGVRTLGVRATDSSGTRGNVQTLRFNYRPAGQPTDSPPLAPTLALAPQSNSGSQADSITNVPTPTLIGVTSPGVSVQLQLRNPDGTFSPLGAPVTSAANGSYQVAIANALADGTYVFRAVATNTAGSTTSQTLTVQILTTRPATAPTLALRPEDDSGIKGDFVTAFRRPLLVGQATPGGIVTLFQVRPNQPLAFLANAVAAPNGSYSIMLPSDLSNGQIGLAVITSDVAGNLSPLSPTYNLRIVSVEGDYNADGRADLPLYRASTGEFLVAGATAPYFQYAANMPANAIPLLGDYDGDGRTDPAVFVPASGRWVVARSRAGRADFVYGAPGDVPVPADWTGDGLTDVAVYRPSVGHWAINGVPGFVAFGGPGDIPVPADYTGDGRADFAVYRPSTGEFHIAGVGILTFPGAVPGDLPMAADLDGDGKADPIVYRPFAVLPSLSGVPGLFETGAFVARFSSNGAFLTVPYGNPGTGYVPVAPFGTPGSLVPMAQDFDGDGRADLALYFEAGNVWAGPLSSGGFMVLPWGVTSARDVAVPGPYAYRAAMSAPPAAAIAPGRSSSGAISAASAPPAVSAASDAPAISPSVAAAAVAIAAPAPEPTAPSVTVTAAAQAPAAEATPARVQVRPRVVAGQGGQPRGATPTGPAARRRPTLPRRNSPGAGLIQPRQGLGLAALRRDMMARPSGGAGRPS